MSQNNRVSTEMQQPRASSSSSRRPTTTTDTSREMVTLTTGHTTDCSRCLPRFMRPTFSPASLEKLYQTYFQRQRQETLLVLLVFAVLFNAYVIIMCAVQYSVDKKVFIFNVILSLVHFVLSLDYILILSCPYLVLSLV